MGLTNCFVRTRFELGLWLILQTQGIAIVTGEMVRELYNGSIGDLVGLYKNVDCDKLPFRDAYMLARWVRDEDGCIQFYDGKRGFLLGKC